MGNLFAESSLSPVCATSLKSSRYTDISLYVKDSDNGTHDFINDNIAFGLAQWRYYSRKQGLLNKAQLTKRSVGDIYLQLDYMWDEIQTYKTVINALYSARTIREASDLVMLKYEKPGNTSESMRQKRARYGQGYYDKFADNKNIELIVSKSALIELYNTIERNL